MRKVGQTRLSRHRGETAFTLVEVLVALGLALITIAGFAAFQSYQLSTLTDQGRQVDLQSTARSVAEVVAREVRNAGANPQCRPAISGLVEARRESLRVQTDLPPGDGLISGANEDVTYRWSQAERKLERIDQQLNQPETLLSDVDLTGSRLRYFDDAGTELDPGSSGLDATQRKSVRRIRFDLELSSANRSGTESRARASTNIELRNRFFLSQNSYCTPTVPVPATQPPNQTPAPPNPTPPPTNTPQAVGTPVPTNTPPPSPVPTTCLPHNADCTADAQCCSQSCRSSNQRCAN